MPNKINNWVNFLSLTVLPNFSHILSEDIATFRQNYYDGDYLSGFIKSFITHIEYPGNDNLIVRGNKGIGKTSFFYYLKKLYYADNASYYIDILHFERVSSDGRLVSESLVLNELNAKLKEYLLSHKNVDRSEIEKISNFSDKNESIQHYKNYILNNYENKRLKKYLFVFDDVDLLSPAEIDKAVQTVFHKLGPTKIIKCISIRDTTLSVLRDQGGYIDTYFDMAAIHNFPSEQLSFYVLNHRLNCCRKNTDTKINIFDYDLCHALNRIHFYDMRKILQTGKLLLDNIEAPQQLDNLGRYFRNEAIKVMMSQQIIENLFTGGYRNGHDAYGIAKELIYRINFKHVVDGQAIADMNRKYDFARDSIINMLSLLVAENFLSKHPTFSRGEAVYYELTKKGLLYFELLHQEPYLISCYVQLPSEDYWKKKARTYKYKGIVENEFMKVACEKRFAQDYR